MIEIRGAEANDIAFLYSSWLRGLRFGNAYFESQDSDAYYASKKEEIAAILCKPDVSVRVACASDDRELILGYVVAQIGNEDANVVWIWVRPAMRQKGLTKQLCQGLRVSSVGNLTKMVEGIVKKKNLLFKPVVINYLKGDTDESNNR